VFIHAPVASAATLVLRTLADARRVPVHAFCIMPDHVHLVLEPSATCSITDFVGQYKNLAQRKAWEQGVRGRIWQTGFYDHFLRADEQVEVVVSYVLNNPVRRKLVSDWREYPYLGSTRLDLEALGGGTSPPPTARGDKPPACGVL
jgi:REP element-mobilizing transposase RayT